MARYGMEWCTVICEFSSTPRKTVTNTNTNATFHPSIHPSATNTNVKRRTQHTAHNISRLSTPREPCANNVRTSTMDSVCACFSPSFQLCMYEYECLCICIGILFYIFFFLFILSPLSVVCCRTSSSVMEFQRCVRSSFAHRVFNQRIFCLTFIRKLIKQKCARYLQKPLWINWLRWINRLK